MRHGFIRTAAVTPKIQVANTKGNGAETIRLAREAAENGAKIIVFPELGITGYTCSDLFLQELLLKSAREELFHIARETADLDALIFVGLPWEKDGKLYNVAAALCGGHLLGLVPKVHIPNYGEFYELRHFTPGNAEVEDVWVPEEGEDGDYIHFGTNLLFTCEELTGLAVAAEICEDVWVPNPPSIGHALAGATVIVNCSASDETTGKNRYRESLIGGQSARLVWRLYLRQRRGGRIQPGPGIRRSQYHRRERHDSGGVRPVLLARPFTQSWISRGWWESADV